jgi:Cu(I)/Ag(I) efflux system membrane protein CusA/SilA
MPTLHEGAFLYMPTALPGMSVTEAQRVLQIRTRILRSFPEVERVFGKAGRATTSTDPAPLNMVETTVVLKPESAWRPGYTFERLQNEMDASLRLPGMPNIWTMPIRNRIDMLSTGMRTPIGLKVVGPDLTVLQDIGTRIEALLQQVPGTTQVVAERTAGGYYVDFELDREALARYGSASTTRSDRHVRDRRRDRHDDRRGPRALPVNVRYARDFRDDSRRARARARADAVGRAGPDGQLADSAASRAVDDPQRERPARGYVYVDMAGRDVGGYVDEAKERVRRELALPTGYTLVWSGQYENMARVRERLQSSCRSRSS